MTAAEPGGFLVRVPTPPGWWELPVLSPDLERDVAALVDDRLRRSPGLADRRDELVAVLVGAAVEARQGGAVFCAQVGIVDEDEQRSAGFVLALRPLPGLGGPEGAGRLMAGVRSLPAPAGVVEDAVEVAPVRLGSLGDGVRRTAVRTLRDGLDVLGVSYYFPLGDGPYVAVVNATSPNVDEADGLLQVLDQIVAHTEITPAPPGGPQPPAPGDSGG